MLGMDTYIVFQRPPNKRPIKIALWLGQDLYVGNRNKYKNYTGSFDKKIRKKITTHAYDVTVLNN